MTMQPIQRVAVIGLGTMGHGIAQSFAAAGCTVTGFDDHAGARNSAKERIRNNLIEFAGAGLIRENEIEPILGRISICESETDAVAEAELVTEAILEDLPLK